MLTVNQSHVNVKITNCQVSALGEGRFGIKYCRPITVLPIAIFKVAEYSFP